ncbi:MAG: hypothetical protein HN348_05915 [Proteobacteria bacterium]|nr:hypothetical protein [Pseudomonadota bacterium]
MDELSKAKVIGVDTESDSFHHFQEKVCLIQFSTLDQDFIVDPLAIDGIESLKGVFSDPSIVKVLHGADYDIVCLRRDFGFQIRSLFDTLIAAQLLGMKRIGLADLIDRFFAITIDKQFQRHDWAQRPLRPQHLEYARGDTHFLLALREILTMRLKRMKRMAHLKEECELLEERQWQVKPFDPNDYLKMKNIGSLDDTGLRVLRRLFLYRHEQAREMDRPTFKVIPNQALIVIAEKCPTTTGHLDKVFPKHVSMKRRHGMALLQCVEEGLDDDFEIPSIQKKPTKKKKHTGPPPRLTGRTAERVFAELKSWRNKVVARDDSRSPTTVASNATLRAIAAACPHNLEELQKVNLVRQWQVLDFGEELLEVLRRGRH